MSLINWMRKHISNSSSLENNLVNMEGSKVGQQIEMLIKKARREGWNSIASIKIYCNNCESVVSIRLGISNTYEFSHPPEKHTDYTGTVMMGRPRQDLKEPLRCRKCEGTRFRIAVNPTNFREWLENILLEAPTCEQDPAIGFPEDETGLMIKPKRQRKATTFDELWQSIANEVDPQGDINPDYEFNTIGTRSLDRTYYAVGFYNYKAKILIVITKDENSNYWYNIEYD